VFEFERMVEGEVPESEYGELVETIRRLTHAVGKPNRVERALAWSSSQNDITFMHVTIAPVHGKTRIRVVSRHDAGAFTLMLITMIMSPVIGTAVAGMLGIHGLAMAGFAFLGLNTAYLADRLVLRRIALTRTKAMTALLDALADEVARMAKPVPRLTP
jgi:hypothetical protein